MLIVDIDVDVGGVDRGLNVVVRLVAVITVESNVSGTNGDLYSFQLFHPLGQALGQVHAAGLNADKD